jgi:hypothetical protein
MPQLHGSTGLSTSASADSVMRTMCSMCGCSCMQGQATWRTSVTALRNSSSGVSAVRRSVLGLLDAATADASTDDDSLHAVSTVLDWGGTRLWKDT